MGDAEKQTADDIPTIGGRLVIDMHHPPHHGMSTGQYLATRLTSLKPPMLKAPNPITLLRMLNRRHWAFFFVAFIAWVNPCASYWHREALN
jgi:SHS family lactate transporter-like MFS transporter